MKASQWQKHVRAFLSLAKARKSLSQRELALLGGVEQATINRALDPNYEFKTKIQPLIEISKKTGIPLPVELMDGGAGLSESSPEYTPPPSNARPAPHQPTMGVDLPILGAALGGDDVGVFMDNGGQFGFTDRPHELIGVSGAYAIKIVGDSMMPRYKDGQILQIDPYGRPTKGRNVVVQLVSAVDGGDRTYLVKEFTRRNDKELVLQQLNPPKEIRIPSRRVIAAHLVVGTKE